MSEGFNGQIDAPVAQQETEKKKTNLCQGKGCKVLVAISVFFVAFLLIAIVGVLCPFLLIYNRTKDMVPPFIFCIYCLLFGVVLVLVQFGFRIFGNFFIFLVSYVYKAIFIIFLGTLSMGSFQDIPKYKVIGFVVGGVIIAIGIFQIIVGCCRKDTAVLEKPSGSEFKQNPVGVQPPSQQTQRTQQQQQPQPQPQQGYDPNRSGIAAAAAMPESQQFAMQAGTVAAGSYLGGASRDEAISAAMNNQDVQRAAAEAAIAGARNDQVRGAAIASATDAARAGAGAAGSGFGYAYDSMFD